MQVISLQENDVNTDIIIPFEDYEISLRFKYLSICQIWIMNLKYKDHIINGLKLSCGVRMLQTMNYPFDFIIENNLNNGFDPYLESDFSDESYSIYILDREDMYEIRGYEVV